MTNFRKIGLSLLCAFALTGCSQREQTESIIKHSGVYKEYSVKVLELETEKKYEKRVMLITGEPGREYNFIEGTFLSKTGEVDIIEVQTSPPSRYERFYSMVNESDPFHKKRNSDEFSKLKQILKEAEEKVRK